MGALSLLAEHAQVACVVHIAYPTALIADDYCRMLLVILGSFLICQPVAFNWDQTIVGHCGNSVTLWLSHGVLNIITDLIVLLLPMPYLYSLEMPLYNKLVLMVTFGLGLL